MTYRSTKTYGHEIGLSCCFRQWQAKSHCRRLHGYALSIHLEFEADTLDSNNWVVDFGSLKSLRREFEDLFDHTLLVAADDPLANLLLDLAVFDLARVHMVSRVGCEAFAELAYSIALDWLRNNGFTPRVRLSYVKVSEHGANSASYYGDSK